MKLATVMVVLATVGACTKTWTVPPGAQETTIVGALVGSEHRIMGDIMRYGFPDTEMLLYREQYVLSYDARNRVPRWVAERLNAKRLQPFGKRKRQKFRVDRDLPAAFRSQSLDFVGSAYVRGRMAAASNHLSDPVALQQTYYLSNVAPQRGDFRQSFWVFFEETIRDWARESDDLYIFTGPLFVAADGVVRYEVIGANQVAVPTHFFKVMLRIRDGKKSMLAFLVPHRSLETDTPLAQFRVAVDEIERLSGLDFFSEIPDPTQSRLEAEVGAVWGEDSAPAEELGTHLGCGCGEPVD